MQEQNPTPSEGGASTLERLESFLAAKESPEPEQTPEPTQEAQAEPESAEEAQVDTEGDAPKEDEGPQLTTADLAKVWGIDESLIDVDDAGQVSIKTKIDGQEGAAKLQDLLKSYQLQGHIDNKSRELAEQQKAIQTRMAEAEQQMQSRLQHAEDLAGIALTDLHREYQGIDWQTLRYTDAAEYAARQHDFQTRNAQLYQSLQAIKNEREQHQLQLEQQQQQTRKERVQQAAEYLAKEIPGWAAGNEMDQSIGKYAKSLGLGEQVSSVIADSPAAGVVLYKAMLYDQLQQSKVAVEAKVRAAPKIVKPGQPQAQTRQEQSIRSIKSTIRNSGGKQGVAEYLIATGKV